MAGATITIDDAQVMAALQRLKAVAGDLGPALRDIGEHLRNTTMQRFRDQVDPDGIPWQDYAPLDEEYRARKPKNADKILVLDAHLSGEIAYQLDGDAVEIGTNTKYGATHQYGREEDGIPARPFLGFPDADKAGVLEIIGRHIENAL